MADRHSWTKIYTFHKIEGKLTRHFCFDSFLFETALCQFPSAEFLPKLQFKGTTDFCKINRKVLFRLKFTLRLFIRPSIFSVSREGLDEVQEKVTAAPSFSPSIEFLSLDNSFAFVVFLAQKAKATWSCYNHDFAATACTFHAKEFNQLLSARISIFFIQSDNWKISCCRVSSNMVNSFFFFVRFKGGLLQNVGMSLILSWSYDKER